MMHSQSTQDVFEYLLRLGDSALIQGQRLCQWCGRAPFLEEELAMMNVGLDLVGQARHWLEYASEIQGDECTADRLAFHRDERAYRNLLLVEQPNGDYALTMLKQFFYDAWHLPVLQGLCSSSDRRMGAIAAKAVKEVTYHLQRSSNWVERLGNGTPESHQRMLEANKRLWPFTAELVSPDTSEQMLQAEGVAPDPATIRVAWEREVVSTFDRATLPVLPPPHPGYLSARRGLHTEHLGLLLAEMQSLPRAYPDASW